MTITLSGLLLSSAGLKNKYLYQGKEYQSELNLALYDFHDRQYDPALGRWTGVDPLASSWAGVSPYAGMVNNPISYVDPDGRNPIMFGLMIGTVVGFGGGYAAGLRGDELLAATLGGMVLGGGIGAGIHTGFFGNLGQGIANVFSSAPGGIDAGIGYAEKVFSGVKPFVDAGLQVIPQASVQAGPITAPGQVVDDYGLSRADYGASYQPSQYAGMNIMQYHQAKTSDAFWNDPVTQGAIDILTTPLPVPKLGMAKMVGRIGGRVGQKLLPMLSQSTVNNVLSSAQVLNRNGLSTAGRALQKHAVRPGPFSNINFSHKTGNQQGLDVLNSIINSKNPIMQSAGNGGYRIFDATTGRGFGLSRDGLFNGFRQLP